MNTESIEKIECGCNCYILTQGQNSILIDAGMKNVKELLNKCREKNVRLLLLTHGHMDHIKNAALVAKTLNIPIAMNEKDIAMISNNLVQPMIAHTPRGKFMNFFSKVGAKFMGIEAFQPDILLKDGDSLEKFGIAGRITELPGHTDESIGVVTEQTFFTGDAMMHYGECSMSLLYKDRKHCRESVKKIRGVVGQRLLCFGHGMESYQ